MKKKIWNKVIIALAAVSVLAGCTTAHQTPVSSSGKNVAYYPVNNRAAAELSVQKNLPLSVRAGEEFSYDILLSNLTDEDLRNVSLVERINPSFKFIGSTPKAQMNSSGNMAQWTMPVLGAGESKKVTVNGSVNQVGTFKNCATVTYNKYICQVYSVTSPKLKLEKFAPAMVSACDDIPIRLVVSNPGSGTAENVVVTDTLPSGLISAEGQKTLTWTVGDLAGGESKEGTFTVQAERRGTFTNVAVAASGGLSAKASAVTRVVKPTLEIVKTAPEKQYGGRNISYTIKVTNTGDGDAVGTIVQDPIPAGTQFVSADNGGRLISESNQIAWNLGTLAPKQSKTVSASLLAGNAGIVRNIAYVSAKCADQVKDDATTKIMGVPALLLETIDVSDPIEVGDVEEYVVQVTNQGTAPDSNVAITFEFEPNMTYVSASGPTTGTQSGQKVTFAPVRTLAPKAKATWRIKTKAVKVGDVRITVRMNSDALSRPVMETEATQIY